MTVLTRDSRNLTVAECAQVVNFHCGCLLDDDDRYAHGVDALEFSKQPPIIQEWYTEWLRDDHYPLSPVDKDHADELWEKFCEEVAKS